MDAAGAAAASEVDVVIPVRDGGERFRRCLAAVTSQREVACRVIVVDNGSTDGSGAFARGVPGVVVVEEPVPGSYAARNRGLASVSAAVVAFTDADCIPRPDWLAQGLSALSAGLDLCAGSVAHTEPRTRWGRYDSITHLRQHDHVAAFGFGATANLFVRREVFERIGPFDASLRSGGDVDLCRRATEAGFRLGYSAGAVVEHALRESFAALAKKSWRTGVGQAALARRYDDLRAWALSWRRLLPPRPVLSAARSDVVLLGGATLLSWIGVAGRLAGRVRQGWKTR